MIQYTGNPYVDCGVAVLELRLKKPCEQFTTADLDAQAKEIKKEYTKKIWKSYLMLHLPNCAWTQKDQSSEKNQAYISKVLGSYKDDFPDLGRKCAFCDQPAKIWADKRYVPLLTGETVMTSGPGGNPGLPVCGYCVFAVHCYPFATLKVNGRPLFWWTPEPQWTRRLTGYFYRDVERVLAISHDELPKLHWPATHLFRAAREVVAEVELIAATDPPTPCDLSGVHATNDGRNPNFDELRIPRNLLDFWREAGALEIYRQIEQQAWESEGTPKEKSKQKDRKTKSEKKAPDPAIADLVRRNSLYEALGDAFRTPDFREKAKQVAARFFLRRRGKDVADGTTALAEFFLEKVAGMERERLEAVRELADAIADRLILEGGDRRVAWQLFRRRLRLGEFLRSLSQIQKKLSELGSPLKWETVLLALGLSNEEDRTASDHWLVQELVLIRLYERLAKTDVIADVPELEDQPDLVTQ